MWMFLCDLHHSLLTKPPTTTTRQNCGNISMISLQPWECFHKSCCAYTTILPGKLVGIFLRFRCSRGNVSASCVVLTQPYNQAQSWECFSTSCNTVFYFNMKELGHAIWSDGPLRQVIWFDIVREKECTLRCLQYMHASGLWQESANYKRDVRGVRATIEDLWHENCSEGVMRGWLWR